MEMKIHQNIMNNKHLLIALGLLLACNHATYAQKGKSKEAKTTFQTAEPWKPETDVRADATMVYGTLDKPGVTFEQRIQSWRDKGYLTEFMTGVAWGDYKDYFLGKWDGVDGHLKEGQRDRNGNEIAHGHLIPYIVPTESFIRYMQETQIKRVIDAGITSIYLVIYLHDELKRENAELKQLLQAKEEECGKVRADYKELENNYTNLKTATTISLNGSDVKETKLRLSKLVREVDKCIALLNE